jgi:hypothetical protein
MSRLRLGCATLATVVVLLAGCASSKKALTGTPETAANASVATASAADGSATTTANGDTSTTIVADGPVTTTANGDSNTTMAVAEPSATTRVETPPISGDAFPGFSEKCKAKYASYLAKVKELGSNPARYKDLVPLFKELLAGAPPDVQAAAQPSLDAFVKFSALIDKYSGDIAKASQDPEFVAVEESFTSVDSKAASKKVEDWLKSTCGG